MSNASCYISAVPPCNRDAIHYTSAVPPFSRDAIYIFLDSPYKFPLGRMVVLEHRASQRRN